MLKKVNLPTKKMGKFAGKWVAIDPIKDKIIAVGETLKEIGPLVTQSLKDKKPVGKAPFSFLVPRKNEGPYVLWLSRP